MMRLTLAAALFVLFGAAEPALAQGDDYNGGEGSVSFSHARVDTGLPDDDFDFGDDPFDDDFDFDDIVDERVGANGFEAAAVGNFHQFVGAKVSVSGHFRDEDIFFGSQGVGVDQSIWNIVGGVQVKDNSRDDHLLRPFGHLMAGVAIVNTDLFDDDNGVFDDEFRDTGFSAVVGGGLDVRVSDRFDLRVIQFDYNPTWIFDQTQHNFRVGVGVVFH
jgi:hypothetical protein